MSGYTVAGVPLYVENALSWIAPQLILRQDRYSRVLQ